MSNNSMNPKTLQNLVKTFSWIEKLLEKVPALVENFKKGYESGNSIKLKERATIVGIITSIVTILFAILTVWGFTIPLDTTSTMVIGSVIVGVIEIAHSVVHVITTKKIGLKPETMDNMLESLPTPQKKEEDEKKVS